MNSSQDTEIEVKYLVENLDRLREKIESMGAQLVQPRTFEQNLRFDDAQGTLSQAKRVLRLRRDNAARITYKGPGELLGGILARQEIEFSLDDFEAGQRFLQALGYQVKMIYEKFRTTYELENLVISLDELPYGDFLEIEGNTPVAIQAFSRQLGLRWDARIPHSYTDIFERLRRVLRLSSPHLTFDSLANLSRPLPALGYRYADSDSDSLT